MCYSLSHLLSSAIRLFLVVATILIAACGGGNSGNNDANGTGPSASPLLSNITIQTYTTNTAITALRFINSGGTSLTSCSANELPSGLQVAVSSNNTSCEITGTPTTEQSATYTITATNANGSNSATVRIAINPPEPILTDVTSQTFVTNTAITILRVINSGGGSLSSCSSDTLPIGLQVAVSADNTTCEITGTPTTTQLSTAHTIMATNAGGNNTATINITVIAQTPFITRWKTDNPGVSDDNQIMISASPGLTYDYQIDWGDGSTDSNVTASITHSYATAGTYTVEISGNFPKTFFDIFNPSDAQKLLSVEQWGNRQWLSMLQAFAGCSNLSINATDMPDLSLVTSMSAMFYNATNFNHDISNWDVSLVTDMSNMFDNAAVFNQNIGGWNVSSVIDMSNMFDSASTFNQNIGSWDVSSVIDMGSMFDNATVFNQDISGWDVSKVKTMQSIFSNTSHFNQDLRNWNISSVTNMNSMFAAATAFNQNIGGWDISSVFDVTGMFAGATLSTENYDALLLGWSSQSLQNNLSFSAGNSTYSNSSQAARDILTDAFNWSVADAGVLQR